jgi:tetratricopeptide (TPR) repeat protein
MTKPDSPTTAAAPYGETERQAAELAALRGMLEASQGCFSLSVAVCNSPALRDYVIAEACESFPGVRVISVPAGTVDVFEFVADGVEETAPAALFLVNLEAAIPSDQDSQPALRSLNASRELWQRRFSCPVLLWLPEYAATLMSIHARDFWRYRSHRFEFVSEQAGAVAGVADQTSGDLGAAAGLTAQEKRFRISELEQRVAEVGDEPPEGLAAHACVWLNELGFLYRFIGDLDRAEQMYRKALQIDEKLGRLEGMGIEYGNLGAVYFTSGDLERAEQMHRKSLDIEEKLGRLEGMASDYGNLGLIYRTRGDLGRAEQMHRKALEIDEKLGRQEGMANTYGNLGSVAKQRGDIAQVRQLWSKSRELFEQIGMPHMVERVQGQLDKLPKETGD